MTAGSRARSNCPRPGGCGAIACARTARSRRQQLDALRDGVTVDGINYGPIEATLDREQSSNVWITFAIREGKNREVRNVLRHLGLQVARLIRVSFGPFQLGEIAEGEVEEVPTRVLRDQLGEKLTKAAGADFSAPIVNREEAEPKAKQNKRARTCVRARSREAGRRGEAEGARKAEGVPNRRKEANSSARGAAKTRGPRSTNPRRVAAAAPVADGVDRQPHDRYRKPVPTLRDHAVMRIVGGRLRGRALAAPKTQAIRPTADRLRESLFNILMHAYGDPISGARVLDLFAGTGALGTGGDLARRGLRAVRRRRRGSARAAAPECRGAGLGGDHAHLPPRRDQTRARRIRSSRFRSCSSIRPMGRAWPRRRSRRRARADG